MKLINKYIFSAGVMLLALVSCTNDDPPFDNPTGTVVDEDGQSISIFNLNANSDLNIGNGTHQVIFYVTAPSLDEDFIFEGTVSQENGVTGNGRKIRLLCRLNLTSVNIPDGDYYITLSGDNLPNLGVFKIKFSNLTVTQLSQSAPKYKGLEGQGTKENPYKLASSGDLSQLMLCLDADPDHGMGLYFSQTASIALGTSATDIIGTTSFQGTYDGNGYSITQMDWHRPAEGQPATDIGLFRTLSNATIKNLVLEDVRFSNIEERGGMLAGSANGRTTISNVTISGSVAGAGQAIGGLIGDVQGAVSIENVTFEKGTLAGKVTHTGGIFGSMRLSTNSSLSNVKVLRDVMVKGDDNTAGMFGYARIQKMLYLNDVEVSANVEGAESVGGYFGYFSMVDNNSLIQFGVDSNTINSDLIIGKKSVGGVAGHARGAQGRTFDFASAINLPVRLEAKEDNIGGIIGYATDIEGLTPGKITTTSALTVTAGGNNAGGLIGYAGNVSIIDSYIVDPENLNVKLGPYEETESTYCSTVIAGSNAGQIAGYANAGTRIEGFFAAGEVSAIKSAAGGILGGGKDVIIKHCEFQGKVSNSDIIGGIVGHVVGHMEMDLCNSSMHIQTPSRWQGGLIGFIDLANAKDTKVNVTNSYFCGGIYRGHNAGGILAGIHADNSCEIRIEKCGNLGSVGAGDENNTDGTYWGVGGLVGIIDSACKVWVKYCFNAGEVFAKAKIDALGGIVGTAGKDSSDINYSVIENCINLSSSINCSDASTKLGGVVGHLVQDGFFINQWNRSTIHGCVNWGEISPDTKHDTGGILGFAAEDTLTEYCYNRGKVLHGNAIIGTHTSGTYIAHQYNYFLAGSGGDWPQSVSIPVDQETNKDLYKKFKFHSSFSESSGFVMTNYGPFPAGLPINVKSRYNNPWPSDLKIM